MGISLVWNAVVEEDGVGINRWESRCPHSSSRSGEKMIVTYIPQFHRTRTRDIRRVQHGINFMQSSALYSQS